MLLKLLANGLALLLAYGFAEGLASLLFSRGFLEPTSIWMHEHTYA